MILAEIFDIFRLIRIRISNFDIFHDERQVMRISTVIISCDFAAGYSHF